MEFLSKLEKTVLNWVKNVPHLPASGQKWLGENIWWIVLIGAILSALGVLSAIGAIFSLMSLMGSVVATYYVTPTVTSWAIVTSVISLAFAIVEAILLFVAIQPLKLKQKKGWVLLFATWLVGIVGLVANSILTLNPISFIIGILFGAIWVAISGYFLFEIHGQFAHVERSRGVKKAK